MTARRYVVTLLLAALAGGVVMGISYALSEPPRDGVGTLIIGPPVVVSLPPRSVP